MRTATDVSPDRDSFTLKNVEALDDIEIDHLDFELHTPDLSPLNSDLSLWTNESIQTAEDTEIGDCAPPSAVTGQFLNTDGTIKLLSAAPSPDLLQECIQKSYLAEDPVAGPSSAPYEVPLPEELKSETDHSYTLLTSPGQSSQKGLETLVHNVPAPVFIQATAYNNAKSLEIIDAQWQPPSRPPPAELTCVVANIEGCSMFSKKNSLHHVVNSGKFSFTATVKNFPDVGIDEIYLKMELRRTNKTYDHIPVDSVCEKHINGIYKHPIQPLTEPQKYLTHGTAQLYKLGKFLPKDFDRKIAISFPCQDSCTRASSGADKGTQAARDSALYVQVVTLNKDGSEDSFTTEFKIPLWIKAAIIPRDLNKSERRGLQGAAAQIAANKRRAEEQQAQARGNTEKKKKIKKLEEISNDTFKNMIMEKIDNNEYSNEQKHYILGL